jgi:hypothetical protein
MTERRLRGISRRGFAQRRGEGRGGRLWATTRPMLEARLRDSDGKFVGPEVFDLEDEIEPSG